MRRWIVLAAALAAAALVGCSSGGDAGTTSPGVPDDGRAGIDVDDRKARLDELQDLEKEREKTRLELLEELRKAARSYGRGFRVEAFLDKFSPERRLAAAEQLQYGDIEAWPEGDETFLTQRTYDRRTHRPGDGGQARHDRAQFFFDPRAIEWHTSLCISSAPSFDCDGDGDRLMTFSEELEPASLHVHTRPFTRSRRYRVAHHGVGFGVASVWDDEFSDLSHTADNLATNNYLAFGVWLSDAAGPGERTGPRLQMGSFASVSGLGNTRAGYSQAFFSPPSGLGLPSGTRYARFDGESEGVFAIGRNVEDTRLETFRARVRLWYDLDARELSGRVDRFDPALDLDPGTREPTSGEISRSDHFFPRDSLLRSEPMKVRYEDFVRWDEGAAGLALAPGRADGSAFVSGEAHFRPLGLFHERSTLDDTCTSQFCVFKGYVFESVQVEAAAGVLRFEPGAPVLRVFPVALDDDTILVPASEWRAGFARVEMPETLRGQTPGSFDEMRTFAVGVYHAGFNWVAFDGPKGALTGAFAAGAHLASPDFEPPHWWTNRTD